MLTTTTRTASALLDQPFYVLLSAVWFGLMTGIAEALVLILAKFFLPQNIFFKSSHALWMMPLANLLIFAALGCIFWLSARLSPVLAAPRFAIFVYAFLAFFGALSILHPQLHQYAAIVLSIGLATQTTRLAAKHFDRFSSLVRTSLCWMLAAVVVLAFSIQGWHWIKEQRAVANLQPPAADAPNVLLIVLDTVRAQNLSLYGYGRETTPQLERFARRGVVFERALSTAPWTLPSHASMFTGRYPHEMKANWLTPLGTRHPTLAEALGARGYLTAGFVANNLYCGRQTGLDRGFSHYDDDFVSLRQIFVNSSLGRLATDQDWVRQSLNKYMGPDIKSAPEVNRAFLNWLSNRNDRPFFAFLNYFDAHNPYLPPTPFDRKFSTQQPHDQYWQENREYSDEELEALLGAYDGSISYVDHHLGLLLDELEKRGVLENTIVIITSDHGEEFGEHGTYEHGGSLYLTALHVPLLILLPGTVDDARSVSEPVTLRDLPATVIDSLNLKDKPRFPGQSLGRYWQDVKDEVNPTSPLRSEVSTGPKKRRHDGSDDNLKSLVLDGYHYIKNGEADEELYDLRVDPFELNNLAASKEVPRALEQLRKLLD